MKRILVALSLMIWATALFAQTSSPLYKGSTLTSLSAATATGPGSVFIPTADQLDNYPVSWTWSAAFTGTPATTAVNLEGSIDYTVYTDGVCTATSTTFTSQLATFLTTDVGKEIGLTGCGPAGATLVTTIAAVGSAHSITLTATVSTSKSSVRYAYSRWFQLDQSTTTTQELRHVTYKPVQAIRCNLATLTGGASPTNTCRIGAY